MGSSFSRGDISHLSERVKNMKGGINVAQQQKEASIEDNPVFVHINDLNDFPLYFSHEEDGEQIPVGIWIVGNNSKRMREIEARHRKRRIRPKDLTGASLVDDSTEKVAYCTVKWQGFGDDDGTELLFNYQNAINAFTNMPHVMGQLQEAMADHSVFGKKGSSPQAPTSDGKSDPKAPTRTGQRSKRTSSSPQNAEEAPQQ